jgi:hypothetical protein
METPAPRRSWSWLGDAGLALLLCTGYGAPVALALGGAASALMTLISPYLTGVAMMLSALLAFGGWLVAGIKVYQGVRDKGRGGYMVALDVLVLAALPAWGLALNFATLSSSCRTTSCDPGPSMFRVLGARGIVGLVAVHALTALAYAVSRRRPARLRPGAELMVHAVLLVGIGLQAALAVQFADLLWALVAFPVTLPLAAPLVTAGLYAHELVARLRRRGVDALGPAPAAPDAVYRASTATVPATVDAPVHRPTLLAALVTAPALAGAYAVVMAAAHRRPAAAIEVFTDTCGHALSRLPIAHVVVSDCHYLCTVAARGTPSLVRPERLGRRNGHPILVNRQLAVANAFEDLLHARWPRFGRAARATYDRLGLPVSRYITRTWMADAVFLAMKPLEWAFYATLLLLDRDDPEARIDRMYR